MDSLFLAPHSDDEALFGSYIIMREKPRVVIITDGTSHVKKFGVSIEERREESRKAMEVLGADVDFLGFSEEFMTSDKTPVGPHHSWYTLYHVLEQKYPDVKRVYVPAKQGGHQHHDTVSDAAKTAFGDKCIYYSTYQKDDLKPIGETPIIPTEEEKQLKELALSKYESQLRINPHHFEAVKDKPEYLNTTQDSWRAHD
jgi:LmbE family N-acetylglucosaminyl deacetylase